MAGGFIDYLRMIWGWKSTPDVNEITISQRYDLEGSSVAKKSLIGTSVAKFGLEGTSTKNFPIRGS